MADENVIEASAVEPVPTATLSRVNAAPAQTWNRLRANDVTLTVPARSRKGDVYFALPRLFESVECGMGEDVTAWVRSQAADARYVEVPAHTRREEPIVAQVKPDMACDTGVMVREGAEATIVVAVGGAAENPDGRSAPSDAPVTSASLLRVIAEAGARVTLIEVVGADDAQQHLESVGIRAGADARVDVRQFLLGGQTSALGFACDLAGDRARLDLACRYYGCDEQTIDINHVCRMRGRNTRAEISESGVLDDSARKALRATIDLVHGARGAQGNEAETVLVLGDGVVNKTIPTILCDEDDVAGNHGATIGSVSPEQIGYLEDRGLSREEAERLFVRALFEDAIIHAPEPTSHAAAIGRAEDVLGADVAHDFDDGGEAEA